MFRAIRNSQLRKGPLHGSGSQRSTAEATARRTSWTRSSGVGVLKPLPARESVNQRRVNRREFGPGAVVLGVAQADQQARSSVRHLVHSIPLFTEISSMNTTQGRKPHKDFPWRLNRLR